MHKTIYTSHYMAADTYSCGAYGANNYGECPTTGTGTSNNPLDALANTGYDVLIPIFLGLALIVASVILVVRRMVRKRVASKMTQPQDLK